MWWGGVGEGGWGLAAAGYGDNSPHRGQPEANRPRSFPLATSTQHCTKLPHPAPCMPRPARTLPQLVEEQRRALRFNDAIVSSFEIGALAPLRATLRLVPASAWAAAAAVAAGAVVVLVLRRRGYSLSALL